MGQLERYGLYVLCLVIFLILGVAIWGSDPQDLRNGQNLASSGINAGVKSEDQHRRDVKDFARAQTKKSLAKYDAAREAIFKKAKDPGQINTGTDGVKTKPIGIKKPEEPKTVPADEVIKHVIKKGDNFSTLAKRYLKNAGLFGRIQKANPGLDERTLQIGQVVYIPLRAGGGTAPVKNKVAISGATHTVKDGESPWRIAAKIVGRQKAHAYSQKIIALNGITDKKQLLPGDVIKLPSR